MSLRANCFIILILSILNCNKYHALIVTDEFISISNNHSPLSIIELEVNNLDSTFGYPSEFTQKRIYTLFDRKIQKTAITNSKVKILFSQKSEKFVWRLNDDIFHANYIYVDTILLKPNIWYNVFCKDYNYELFIFSNGKKGDFIVKTKPKPGAW